VPIYSPRTAYSNIRQNDDLLLSDLTLNFDPFTINVLKSEFQRKNQRLQLTDFILIIKEHLLSWQVGISNREYKLIRCLINLFRDLDLNSNSFIEWDEFASYIIQKATVINKIKTKGEEIKLYTKSEVRPLAAATRKAIKFGVLLAKVIYIPKLDKLAFFEENSDEVMFMRPDNGVLSGKNLKVHPKPLVVKISQVKKDALGQIHIEKKENLIEQRCALLDVLYIADKKYEVLITSTNDGYIRGWRANNNTWSLAFQPDNDEELIEHHFAGHIYRLAWDSLNEILYCGQYDGLINIWKLKTDTESQLEDKSAHTAVITDMIAMPKLQFLASASLDGKLILWNTINDKKKRVYTEHTRGITSLAFNEAQILLFSGGFDHFVCVWNPYIDNLIYKIAGHSCPIQGLSVIEGTSQLITLGIDGTVKVIDIKKFSQVQQFTLENNEEKHQFSAQCLTYIPKPLSLAVCGKSVQLFEYDKNYNPVFADDNVSVSCAYIPSQLSFYTPAGSKIKLWNALTGQIAKIFTNLSEGEITVFTLDNLKKRILIGDSLGKVTLLNIINAAKLKSLQPHLQEVTHLVHAPEIKAFISAGLDNKIIMTLDNDLGELEILRVLELKEVIITALQFEPLTQFVVVGTNNGIAGFYESDTGKLHGTVVEQVQYEEISAVCILPEMPFIILTSSLGRVSFVALPPFLFKFTKVFSFANSDTKLPAQGAGITAATYAASIFKLFLADERGGIKCYDIRTIVERLATTLSKAAGVGLKDKTKVSVKYCEPPQFADFGEVQPEWAIKAHSDVIKHLELI